MGGKANGVSKDSLFIRDVISLSQKILFFLRLFLTVSPSFLSLSSFLWSFRLAISFSRISCDYQTEILAFPICATTTFTLCLDSSSPPCNNFQTSFFPPRNFFFYNYENFSTCCLVAYSYDLSGQCSVLQSIEQHPVRLPLWSTREDISTTINISFLSTAFSCTFSSCGVDRVYFVWSSIRSDAKITKTSEN